MEIVSIREKLARAADTEHSNKHMCARAKRFSGRARCGTGAGFSAIKYQSLTVPRLSDNPVTLIPDGRFQLKREPLKTFQGRAPASQGQKLALTVLPVPETCLDCLICAEGQKLALTVLHVPTLLDSGCPPDSGRVSSSDCRRTLQIMRYLMTC